MAKRDDLRALRESLGMTQQEAANAAGISNMTVSRAERGQGMALDTAKALAKLYGVPVEHVTGDAPMPRPTLPSWDVFWAGVLELLPEPPTREFAEYVRLSYERMLREKREGSE